MKKALSLLLALALSAALLIPAFAAETAITITVLVVFRLSASVLRYHQKHNPFPQF